MEVWKTEQRYWKTELKYWKTELKCRKSYSLGTDAEYNFSPL
jgi:hypothetical protein